MKKLTLALMLATSSLVYADISVSPLWLTLQPTASTSSNAASTNFANITVTNPSSTIAYVQTTLAKTETIGDPKSPSDAYQPGDNVQAFGLLATPSKFAIQPNSSVTVRVTNLNLHSSADALYTLLFTPISSPVTAPVAAANTTAQATTLNMRVVVSYRTNILVLPSKIAMKVCAKSNGTSATITNNGNTLVSLVGGKLCDSKGANCEGFSKFDYTMIPAGGTLNIPTPQGDVLTYLGFYGPAQNTPLNISTQNPCT